MMTAHEFEKKIKKATKGLSNVLSGPGRTSMIAAALEAYEDSVAKGEAQAEQAAYIYQVRKECDNWIRLKLDEGDATDSQKGRMAVIIRVRNEAHHTLGQYPLVQQALDRYARNKAGGPKPTLHRLKKVYAHEGAAYQQQKEQLKAQGQFVDPGQPRYAPSASLIGNSDNRDDRRVQNTAFANGKTFADLDFTEFMELDRLLGRQYKVLYMTKIQRLQYMAACENGRFFNVTAGAEIDMSGSTVDDDLERGVLRLYACDRYGNLFIVAENHTVKGQKVQVNHSTLLGGREVLCAGTISIKRGILRGITNLSGHYKPDGAALSALVADLGQAVEWKKVAIKDMARGITTTGERYIAQDYTDRAKEFAVTMALASR